MAAYLVMLQLPLVWLPTDMNLGSEREVADDLELERVPSLVFRQHIALLDYMNNKYSELERILTDKVMVKGSVECCHSE